MAFFWPVFFRDRKEDGAEGPHPRHRRPSSLRVPPLILREPDRIADILFGAVGVEGHLGSVEPDQQLRFSLFESGQQVVQVGKAGGAAEDAIEAGLER